MDYHRSNSKETTVKSYSTILNKFCLEFGGQNLYDLTSEEILSFLNRATENRKPQTKNTRYAHLSSFFNFILNNIDPDFRNPCSSPMMRKQFRAKAPAPWDIIEKEIVDEVIFRTQNTRNRLLLELMARGGMRIGEVLKLWLYFLAINESYLSFFYLLKISYMNFFGSYIQNKIDLK